MVTDLRVALLDTLRDLSQFVAAAPDVRLQGLADTLAAAFGCGDLRELRHRTQTAVVVFGEHVGTRRVLPSEFDGWCYSVRVGGREVELFEGAGEGWQFGGVIGQRWAGCFTAEQVSSILNLLATE